MKNRIIFGLALLLALLSRATLAQPPSETFAPRILRIERFSLDDAQASAQDRLLRAAARELNLRDSSFHFLVASAPGEDREARLVLSFHDEWSRLDAELKSYQEALEGFYAELAPRPAAAALYQATDGLVASYSQELSSESGLARLPKMKAVELVLVSVQPGSLERFSEAEKSARARASANDEPFVVYQMRLGAERPGFVYLRPLLEPLNPFADADQPGSNLLQAALISRIKAAKLQTVVTLESYVLAFLPRLSRPPLAIFSANPNFWQPRAAAMKNGGVQATGHKFLVQDERESAGYGLYSYLLFSLEPSPEQRPRYLAVIEAVLRSTSEIAELEKHIPRSELNVLYIPVRAGPPGRPTAEWVLDNYNYDRARILWTSLPENARDGPVFVSALEPLTGVSRDRQRRYLFQDLTQVDQRMIEGWVSLFRQQATRSEFWATATFSQSVLQLRNLIAQAAGGLADVKSALASWIAWKGP